MDKFVQTFRQDSDIHIRFNKFSHNLYSFGRGFGCKKNCIRENSKLHH